MAQIRLTAQNIDIYEGDGLDPFARTGATSAEEIYKAGATGVILGHSEVGDTPEVTKKKFASIVKKSEGYDDDFLTQVTLLVGESWDEFEGNSPAVIGKLVSEHLAHILEGVPDTYINRLVVGYEPKWGSRGSGRDDMPPPAPELIHAVAKTMKEKLVTMFGNDVGTAVPIIYGGRSTPERTEQILADENVEGLILGSACNTVKKTMDIAAVMEKIRPGKRKVLHANFKAFDLSDSYEDYVKALSALDSSFVIYISPAHTDLREVRKLI